jgi:hypothetical protein
VVVDEVAHTARTSKGPFLHLMGWVAAAMDMKVVGVTLVQWKTRSFLLVEHRELEAMSEADDVDLDFDMMDLVVAQTAYRKTYFEMCVSKVKAEYDLVSLGTMLSYFD